MEEQNQNQTETPIEELLPPTNNIPSFASQNDWRQLFTNLSNTIPIAPNYGPRVPLNFNEYRITNPCRLYRRIYNNMLTSIDSYTKLLDLAPEADIGTIQGLRSQMQILSIAILSLALETRQCRVVPFRNTSNSNLPNNYLRALHVTYNRVYTVFFDTVMLYQILGTNQNSTRLLIIINNLRSQLATIDDLIIKNQ